MMYNGKNYLMFERRGCEFWKDDKANEESDIGNYRITTPGEIVPCKNGRNYCFEFGCYDRYNWRKTNKRNGKPLQKAVKELVMTTATHIDTQFTDYSETKYGLSYSDCAMEREFYEVPMKYTKANILAYINSVSAEHYDEIMFVDTFQFEEPKTANFVPASKIIEWAKAHKVDYCNALDGIVVYLATGKYKYSHYKIEQAHKPENEIVTIYLERVNN